MLTMDLQLGCSLCNTDYTSFTDLQYHSKPNTPFEVLRVLS